ncbi:MAG TPA: dihydrofolate reductase [Candidatus Omnitrophota bacterium]|nr:dihydrofolate reductase [Candidatus Omnitrophota bacterium]
MKPFSIVVATDTNNGIGKNGQLPWHLPGDLKYFRELTSKTKAPDKKNAVIMGRKTWESIPPKFRPLAGRINIVLTKNKDLEVPVEVYKAQDFDQAFEILEKAPLMDLVENIYVIGGAKTYQEALKKPECQKLYITQVLHSFSCDAFFPPYRLEFERRNLSKPHIDGDTTYYFTEYVRTRASSVII